MIYTTGTIAISGNTVTGKGTNFSAPLSLIRVGCTLIAIGNPVQIFTITEIKSGTELSVTPAANPAIPAGTKFSILLTDSISVDGLAQDVAETLRYYQGQETEIAAAVEWWKDFGGDGRMDQLLADIRAETAQSTANAQKTEADKKTTEGYKNAAATSATAAKSSQDAAKASETSASNSKTAAATSETNAAKAAADALNYRNQAQGIVGNSIGLSSNPRDCPDISGNPSGYIGFLRIMAGATGWPSVASGESYLSGFICPTLGGDPTFCGLFIGQRFGDAYTYRWHKSTGPRWIKHVKKDDISRFVQGSGETALWAAGGKQKFVLWDGGTGESINWGVYDNPKGKWCPLKVAQGGTGGVTPEQARTNLEAMREQKSALNETNINTLTGEYSGFYYQTTNSSATTDRGYPVAAAGALLVMKNGANSASGCTQLYFPYNSTNGAFYMRQHLIRSQEVGWGWTDWKKFLSLDYTDSPQFKNLNLVISSDNEITNGGILQSILSNTSGAQRARTRIYTEFRGDGKAWTTTHLQSGSQNKYAGLSEDGDFALSTGDFVGRSARLVSSVNAPFTLTSAHPTIKFDETDRPEGAPDYAFIFDGGSWRIEKNHWENPSGGNCIRYNYIRNEIEVPNLKVINNATFTRIYNYDSAFSKRLGLITSDTVSKDAEIYLWGESTRPTVLEFKLKEPGTDTTCKLLFYGQLNADDTAQLQVNGAVNCTTVNQSSDRDLKDNIQVIGDATEAIRKMNGYTYTLKENGLPYAGVIAQEVMEALPEAVGSFTHYGEALQGPTIDGNELREETRYLNVDYAAVTGLLVQVARETDNRVTELEEENASLRANIAVMDERIAKLEALVSKLTGSEK